MIVTFDNKIVFYRPDKRVIEWEQISEEIKIYDGSGTRQLKDKKTKVKYCIDFDKGDQEDEFLLHIQKMNIAKWFL